MAHSSFDSPTSAEMHLRRRLADAAHRLRLYEKDASGKAVIGELDGKVQALEAEAASLKAAKVKNANLINENKGLKATCSHQKKQIASLKADLAYSRSLERGLERKLAKAEKLRYGWAERSRALETALSEALAENRRLKAKCNRNSQNSSLPPSSSPIKKVHNSRVKTGRMPGGQPGHKGHRRRQYAPDAVVACEPATACPECGSGDLVHEDETMRCLTDLLIALKTTGYTASACMCQKCGAAIDAPFPDGVVNEQNYGNNIRAITTYLVNRLNVSGDNAVDFLYEASGHALKVSTGSVRNFLKSFSKKAESVIAGLEGSLKACRVVGSDATHTSTSGKQSYVYGFVGDDLVIYQPSQVKGNAPLKASPIAGFKGILVHDHDIAYYNFGGAHAECNEHVLRDLKGVVENEPERTWAAQMIPLLCEANELAKKAREKDGPAISGDVLDSITSRYGAIIKLAEAEYERDGPFMSKYKPEGIALSRRLGVYQENHLLFMYDLSVPFTNNFTEQALRRVKMKTKQSGGFRSFAGGQSPYCDFLTITQTASMREMEVLEVVRSVFDGKADIFTGQEKPVPAPDP